MSLELAYLGAGGAIGAAHWGLLWGSVRLLAAHPRGLRLYTLLAPLRFVILAVSLAVVVAQGGALAGLLALAGVMAARAAAVKLARRAGP